jgi:predicted O-linked N-acetylglucosamine transferase (SPINDLY family)
MGAPYVDYLIGDAIVCPFEHASDYTETLVHLPYSYQPNDRARPIAESAPRETLGLPADTFVYCCFNNSYKFNPEYLDTLGRIANAAPDSVLWFLARGVNDPAIENLRREASRRGIAGRRMIFASARSNPEYLALYRHADLFLDAWPYNGHTTVSDALWAGCPVVTLLGETFAGRVAASLLTAVGLPGSIAPSVDAFVDEAIAVTRDRERHAALHNFLAGPGRASPLFDTLATTRALEAAYVEIAAQCSAGVRKPFRIDRLGHASSPDASQP